MSKHTPGPWHVELIKKWPFGINVTASNGRCIVSQSAAAFSTEQRNRRQCECGIGFDKKDAKQAVAAIAEQDANARLIAAAPDLMEALQELDMRLRACHSITTAREAYDSFYQELVRGAIAKATGEQQ